MTKQSVTNPEQSQNWFNQPMARIQRDIELEIRDPLAIK